jgi:hypothetical protein
MAYYKVLLQYSSGGTVKNSKVLVADDQDSNIVTAKHETERHLYFENLLATVFKLCTFVC